MQSRGGYTKEKYMVFLFIFFLEEGDGGGKWGILHNNEMDDSQLQLSTSQHKAHQRMIMTIY
jgi:hypothetical protein